eukprot:RCo016041
MNSKELPDDWDRSSSPASGCGPTPLPTPSDVPSGRSSASPRFRMSPVSPSLQKGLSTLPSLPFPDPVKISIGESALVGNVPSLVVESSQPWTRRRHPREGSPISMLEVSSRVLEMANSPSPEKEPVTLEDDVESGLQPSPVHFPPDGVNEASFAVDCPRLRTLSHTSSEPGDDALSSSSDSPNNPMLKFQRYCEELARLEQEDTHFRSPVTIELRNGFCSVKKYPPAKKVPSMWSPVGRWLCLSRMTCEPVLHHLNAIFPAGKMNLIVGAPGSGKSSLLKMLAGKLSRDRFWKAGGLFYNGLPAEVAPLNPGSCFSFVPESDAHHIPTMTVRDTLKFAFCCKSTYREKDANTVDNILEILGLTHVATSVIGDASIRGISGGERRRVTIGEMWVSNVKVLLADHLTDGLDSATTCDIIKALKIWCTTLKTTVVMTLQQPPPEVYQHFDNVCVLEDSSIVFTGSLKDAAEHFRRLGYTRPEVGGGGSSILSVPQQLVNLGSGVAVPQLPTRNPFDRTVVKPMLPTDDDEEFGGRCGCCICSWAPVRRRLRRPRKYARAWGAQFCLCLRRHFVLENTNVGLLLGRVLFNLLTGLLTAGLWQGTPQTRDGLDSLASLVFHCCMSVVLSVAVDMAPMYNERVVFYKQHSSCFYSTSAYWVANNFTRVFFWGFVETGLFLAPIYWMIKLKPSGSSFLFFWFGLYLLNVTASVMFKGMVVLFPTLPMAQTIVGLLESFFFVFSGYLIPWDSLPAAWWWAQWVSPQSYAYAAVLADQFSGVVVPCTQSTTTSACVYSGDNYLAQVHATVLTPWTYMGLLIAWAVFWLAVGLALLTFV